jgi:hypothetical protein
MKEAWPQSQMALQMDVSVLARPNEPERTVRDVQAKEQAPATVNPGFLKDFVRLATRGYTFASHHPWIGRVLEEAVGP